MVAMGAGGGEEEGGGDEEVHLGLEGSGVSVETASVVRPEDGVWRDLG